MKVIVLAFFAGLALAQAPLRPGVSTPPASPVSPAASDHELAQVPPTTVVAEVNGKKYTAGEVTKLLADFPPPMQAAVRTDPKRALGYLLLMQHLSELAVADKADQEPPTRETLEYQRLNTLSQAEINHHRNVAIVVTAADQEGYYNAHKDRFVEAKVKVIYIPFTANPVKSTDANAPKQLNQAEAKAKAEDLRKQALGGADFGELAHKESGDKESAAKNGDFGVIKRTSSYPEAIKEAVFALKPGEISQPLAQPNGFYLIKLESLNAVPYADVKNQIYDDVKNARFAEWMKSMQTQFEVKVENSDYFSNRTVPTAPHP